METENKEKKKGFAAIDPVRQKEIASKGGRIAHQNGRAHRFTSEEAREAGRKGGRTIAQNIEHMSEIGRRGGEARKRRRHVESENV